MVRRCHTGSLCTIVAKGVLGDDTAEEPPARPHGDCPAPYASWVTVATDQAGAPLLLLSTLAVHTRALMANPRAALLVIQPTAGVGNPQEDDRVTLMGRLDRDPDPRLRARFLARHPYATSYAAFADFALWRMSVTQAHRVAGFGAAAWIDAPEAMAVEPALASALTAEETELLARLADDHPDLASRIARRHLGLAGDGWRLVALDADGVDLDPGPGPETAESRARVERVCFPRPLDRPAAVRSAVLALVDGAKT